VPLPREHLLDELATAYVQTIAAVAGATIAVSRRDYGVDGTIKQIAKTDDDGYFETGFPVEFQLKGTTLATRPTSTTESIIYDLKVRNYNLITTRHETATPYFLFLICFASEVDRWAVAAPDALILNASAFWWSGVGPRSENASSVRIAIPAANRLTFEAVGNIMKSSQARFET
jgi:uncharacterized protein DUF4365